MGNLCQDLSELIEKLHLIFKYAKVMKIFFFQILYDLLYLIYFLKHRKKIIYFRKFKKLFFFIIK